MKKLKKVYNGKTKDIYDYSKDLYLIKFKDNILGYGNTPYTGSNKVIGKEKGRGEKCCAVNCLIFDRLNKNKIKTHFVKKVSNDSVLVKKLTMLPFEIILRNYAYGSFIERYGNYIKEMTPLNNFIEFTLKDDLKDDPQIDEKTILLLKLLKKREIEQIKKLILKINKVLIKFFKERNRELIDMKLEFGRIKDQPGFYLADDLSPNTLRDGGSKRPKVCYN